MKRYINNLDYEFVRVFGEKLGLRDYHVRFDAEGWHLNFDRDIEMGKNILLGDFLVETSISKSFCKEATKLWNVEMYKKFGKPYLRDLKRFKIEKSRINQYNQEKIIKSEIQEIERNA